MEEYEGWLNTDKIGSRDFRCGHCGNNLASQNGYFNRSNNMRIYLCHFCAKPTYFLGSSQIPGAIFGDDITGITDNNVLELYNEARKCVSCNAFTASVLCCRKLLMHIAVSKGAKEGLSFIEYIQFLSDKGYVPPDGKDWVDHIRTKGNDATHEIILMQKEDAEDLIIFIGMLLKVIYEFPEKIRKKKMK